MYVIIRNIGSGRYYLFIKPPVYAHSSRYIARIDCVYTIGFKCQCVFVCTAIREKTKHVTGQFKVDGFIHTRIHMLLEPAIAPRRARSHVKLGVRVHCMCVGVCVHRARMPAADAEDALYINKTGM